MKLDKFCSNCGARLNEGANFCSSCGRSLKSVSNSSGWLYETFLRREGRLNRWSYFKRTLLATLIEVLTIMAMAVVLAILVPNEVSKNDGLIATMLLLAIISLNFYLTYGLIIRRCHDLKEDSLLHTFISKDDTSVAKFIIVGSVVSFILDVFEFNEIMVNLVDIVIGVVSIYLIFAPGKLERMNTANEIKSFI